MDFECTLKTLIKPYETENLIFNNVINNYHYKKNSWNIRSG